MLVRVASSTTAAACSTPRTGSPVAVAAATRRAAVAGSAMLPHSTWMSAPVARIRAMVFCARAVGLRAAGQHDPATARRGHPRGEEQPEPTQATGDDVGAVAAKDPSPLRRHHHATVPRRAASRGRVCRCAPPRSSPESRWPPRQVDRWCAPGAGNSPSRDEPVHRTQQVLDLLGVAGTHQRQVDIVEREVAAEGI